MMEQKQRFSSIVCEKAKILGKNNTPQKWVRSAVRYKLNAMEHAEQCCLWCHNYLYPCGLGGPYRSRGQACLSLFANVLPAPLNYYLYNYCRRETVLFWNKKKKKNQKNLSIKNLIFEILLPRSQKTALPKQFRCWATADNFLFWITTRTFGNVKGVREKKKTHCCHNR